MCSCGNCITKTWHPLAGRSIRGIDIDPLGL